MKNIEAIINEYLNIKESYQLPEKMLTCLMDPVKKVEMFNLVLEHYPSLESDIFFEYFESEHANKDKLKQDFTPPEICEIVAQLSKKVETIKDICAGTGGLSIKQINKNPNAYYIFEEISERTLPLLLFNLAIRNIDGIIKRGDSLTREFKEFYKLEKSDKYSKIRKVKEAEEEKVDLVISNPPYSLDWDQSINHEGYDLAPKSKADYAFVLNGLNELKEDGEMFVILPHGVLFRGGTEGKIRKQLIENNLIDMVVGMPGKMFIQTDIPTIILKIKKNRDNTDIYFIDASKECIKTKRLNEMTEQNIKTVVGVANIRKPIDLLADVSNLEKIREHEYNLNIPRHVDTYVPDPVPNLLDTVKEYVQIEKEITELESKFIKNMYELVDCTEEGQKELDEVRNILRRKVENEQLEFRF